MATLKWGIIGLGGIAHKFVKDLMLVEGQEVFAVASRNQAKADDFARTYGIENTYGSYKDLFANPDVDIVYVATPHDSHADLSIEAMNHNKHVLCEKPLAINRGEVEAMVEASTINNVFLMEAFWSRFNPTIVKAKSLIDSGEIGNVNYVNADFCFYGMDSPKDRVLNKDLAGGALLDIGVYPVFLSYLIFGMPQEIKASAIFHTGGADIQTGAVLKYSEGLANITCGFNSNSQMIARIYGDKGSIMIDDQWHRAQGFSVIKNGDEVRYDLPTKGMGFTYEIEECAKCIQSGKTESSIWSHANSVDLISICDDIRRQTGLVYDNDYK